MHTGIYIKMELRRSMIGDMAKIIDVCFHTESLWLLSGLLFPRPTNNLTTTGYAFSYTFRTICMANTALQ